MCGEEQSELRGRRNALHCQHFLGQLGSPDAKGGDGKFRETLVKVYNYFVLASELQMSRLRQLVGTMGVDRFLPNSVYGLPS
jgi:hypothetical protein